MVDEKETNWKGNRMKSVERQERQIDGGVR